MEFSYRPYHVSTHPGLRTEVWRAVHHGLEYPGEVVFARDWDPAWGEPLAGRAYFRIVFLERHRALPANAIGDGRIAVCVPRRGPGRQREGLNRELLAIAEAKTAYAAQPGPDASLLRRSLEEREAELATQLRQQDAHTYLQGRVHTKSGVEINPAQVFSIAEPADWVQRIAVALLSHAYPSPPVDPATFPRPLASADVPLLFRALLGDDAAPECRLAAEHFATGLGLASPQNPYILLPGRCPAFDIIQAEMERQEGTASWEGLERTLSHAWGLPHPLLLLFLLAFVRVGSVEAEVHLKSGHEVICPDGTPFPSQRIARPLVAEVGWREDLGASFEALAYAGPPAWTIILPYASLLREGLSPAEGPAAEREQEALLTATLQAMAEGSPRLREALEELASLLGPPIPADSVEALERLQRILEATSAVEFYQRCAEHYASPSALARDVQHYRRVEDILQHREDIRRVKAYLEETSFGTGHGELAMDREILTQRLTLPELVANPSLWEGLSGVFDWFRARYQEAYSRHHEDYHREAQALVRQLERVHPQVQALAVFNTIPELGPATLPDASERHQRLLGRCKVCHLSADHLSLETRPLCPTCGLRMDEEAPRREAEELLGGLEAALRKKNQSLGSHAVRQVLQQDTEGVEKFIKLVQSADPSSLANVLDDDVVEFLRQFLRSQ